ncbi:MAG: IclR family transcriptional regulator [Myxococcales bacterium]|nr:IclR family transcriptional regulator [Myxococcales bacterium]MDH5305878.1 IclR family transcriptional regulator [Myxococcales bacterium]MDH5565338.1 IclR family transcriptional regulator [Myxococcales bacterium]
MKKPKSDYAIQTVTNALRLLEVFRDEQEVGVAELSRRLGLHKNNVFRLLATLEEAGYIEQSPVSERYRLGVSTLEIGHSYLRSRELLARARPVVVELSGVTEESAHLATLHGFDVVHVDGAAPSRLVLTGLRVGRRLPVHCTALGKVLLGCGPEAQRELFDRALASNGGLERRTPRTIVDSHKFFEHIRSVAVHGFALDVGECEVGLVCVAAPVHDASEQVIAALSVSAPSFRASEEDLIDRLCPAVTSAAERLSRELGYGA